MKTVLEIILSSTSYLTTKKVERPRREAEEIIADALHLKRLDLYLQFDRPLNDEELSRCREALRRRGLGEPVQYIAGVVSFGKVTLKINPSVLIPRPETEILVEKIAADLKGVDLQGKVLWDMCTGSGSIAISLKKRFPELSVFASDLSADALKVAKENALQNEVDITFLEGDLFAPFKDQKTHFFVCNPPYISESEYLNLSREVRDFEPKGALLGGPTGLEFYAKIAKQLKNYLEVPGKAWFEIGTGQGESIASLFLEAKWATFSHEKDWGGHDRYFLVERLS